MSRHPVLALIMCSSLLWAAGCAGDDDDGDNSPPPQPTTPPDAYCATTSDVLENGPKTWAIRRQIYQEVLVYLPTGDKWYPQYSVSDFLITWKDDGQGGLTQHEELCDVTVSDIDIDYKILGVTVIGTQSTEVPDRLIDVIPQDDWKAVVADGEVDGHQCAMYSMPDTYYSVWGAHVDALTGECPADSSESGWYDQDGDTEMGVTIKMYADDELAADTFVCQRLLFKQESAQLIKLTDGTYFSSGAITHVTNDQSQYGAEGPHADLFIGNDPEVRWSSNDKTYFVMRSLPEGSTCADVSSTLFE